MNAIILHTDDRVVVHDKTPYDDKITVKSANQSVDVCQSNDTIRVIGQSGGDGIPYDGPYSVASILFSDIKASPLCHHPPHTDFIYLPFKRLSSLAAQTTTQAGRATIKD